MAAADSASIRLSDESGALQSRAATADFLAAHPPYDAVPRELLLAALAGARLSYYARGQVLRRPEDGVPEHFSVVQQGLVRGVSRDDSGQERRVFEAGPGESFLHLPLQEQRATRTVHEAAQDSFILDIPRAGFDLLIKDCPAFVDFCQRRASTLVEQARRDMALHSSAAATSGHNLDSTLAELLRREPVTSAPQVSVMDAVRQMHATRVGSVVVVDEKQGPLGIFTLHDLRALVAEGTDLEQPISAVMTPQPICLPAESAAFEAAMAMVDNGMGHVPVTREGRLVGVVSQRDLFALQRVDAVQLVHEIQRADGATRLAELQSRVRDLVHAMLAHGASTRQLTRLITRINDAIVERIVALARDEAGHSLPPFTWLAFGSEARGEQTFSTDQDNGLLFRVPEGESADQLRQRYLPVAQRINELLDRTGFPLCRGRIMGGNPELCLSESEWQARFASIIRESSPENLLKATILFDCRAVAGPPEPQLVLRQWVADQSRQNTRFLHALARHALEWRPPLGLFRSFVTRDDDSGRSLDLKAGLQIFVSAARVLALSEGIQDTNTEDRLMAVAAAGRIAERDAQAWCEGFAFIQQLRMRGHQAQLAGDKALSNQLDPDRLNPLERRILKEAFRQARRLQTRLKLDYP